MATRTALPVLRLALARLDAGDVAGARALVTVALELVAQPERPKAIGLPSLATPAGFGALAQATPRTVRRWIANGRIPRDAVSGAGRGMRIDVERALAALKSGESFGAESAGTAHVTRRRALKAVG